MIRRPLFVLILATFAAIRPGFQADADELPVAPEGTFTIAVIPDTQHYAGKGTKKGAGTNKSTTNSVFESYTDCIVEELDRQRIVFVSHVGDIVDVNNDEQWSVARRCMDKLHGKVPYGISVGNHDMVTRTGNSSLFQKYFPASRFNDFEWYGGCYLNADNQPGVSGNNSNSFQIFSAGGMKFVALHLECNAPDNVLRWADEVLEKHSERRAFITTHMGLGPLHRPKNSREFFDAPKGRMLWKKCHGANGNTSQQMWDKCFSRHKNLFLICCGDQSRTQALHQTVKGRHGNRVHEVLSDYGSNGFRLMRFVPNDNRIDVRTWNPMKQKLCEQTSLIADRKQHQFSLDYLMSRSQPPQD